MKTIQLNTLQNVKSSEIHSSITIEEYISKIRDGFDLSKITTARKVGKGTPTYTSIKENRNAVLFNFNFINKRRNSNIVKQTNLLFFDIDVIDDTNPLKGINTDNFYIVHKSFGGKGYTLIAKVEGIRYDSHTSFKEDYLSIASQLSIKHLVDVSAIKMTQPTIMSYDKNIAVNEGCKVFKPIINKESKKSIILPISKDKSNIGSKIPFSKRTNNLKYETTLEEYTEDCVYIEEGKEYVECKLPFKSDGTVRKLVEGERRKWLSLFCNNLLYINGYINRQELFLILSGINQKYCIKKLTKDQLYKIVDYKLQMLKQGTLEAFNPRLKKYWTKPSIKSKREVYDAKRRSLSDDSLNDFFGNEILNINKKITQKLIAEYTGLSIITIKRRFKENPEYKKIVKEVNLKLKK